MAWNGRGMVWHVMVRVCYCMTWHVSGIVWHGRGMAWHGRNMVWHGMIWVWYGRTELSHLGSRWFVFVHGVCPNSHSFSEGRDFPIKSPQEELRLKINTGITK